MQDKWNEVLRTLGRTVQVDSSLRAFYAGPLQPADVPFAVPRDFAHAGAVDVGLLFECRRGELQLHQPPGVCCVLAATFVNDARNAVYREGQARAEQRASARLLHFIQDSGDIAANVALLAALRQSSVQRAQQTCVSTGVVVRSPALAQEVRVPSENSVASSRLRDSLQQLAERQWSAQHHSPGWGIFMFGGHTVASNRLESVPIGQVYGVYPGEPAAAPLGGVKGEGVHAMHVAKWLFCVVKVHWFPVCNVQVASTTR